MLKKNFNLKDKKWKSGVKRILVIYWGMFGDLIITLPFIVYLRKLFPQAKIVYLIGGTTGLWVKSFEHGSRILESHPAIDGYKQSKPLIIEEILRDKPYDLVVDLCKTTYSSVLSHLSAAKVEIYGRFRGCPKRFFIAGRLNSGKWSIFKKIKIKDGLCRVEHFLTIIRSLGGKTSAKVMPKLYLTKEEKIFSRRVFKKISRNGRFIVGIHPGGRARHRLWGARNYSLLADRLIEELNAEVVIFYASKEKELADRVCKYAHHRLIKVSQKDTRKYMSLVWRCQVFISTDGGPMHIALALGVSCVCMVSYKPNMYYWYGYYPKSSLSLLQICNHSLKKNEKEVGEVFKRAKLILRP